MTLLAADIGGTYSRLAWSESGAHPRETIVKNASFDALEDVIDHALHHFEVAGQAIECMTLAVPGPVHTDPVVLTNINWRFARNDLEQRFNVTDLFIVNDFQAAAIGAVLEPFEALKQLNPGTTDQGPVVVAGAGTGLGMAWFAGSALETMPQATEGGHMDFAPQDRTQQALHDHLAERYGHVSYERLLSGDGLVDIHGFLSRSPRHSSAAIHELAKQGDAHAVAAVRLFVDVFAAYAGNLALSFNPTGGIYLCGGLSIHLADWFDPVAFQQRFTAKGRMAELTRRIPVFLVTRHNTGLAGATRLARLLQGRPHEYQ